jgi:hypothetical protein
MFASLEGQKRRMRQWPILSYHLRILLKGLRRHISQANQASFQVRNLQNTRGRSASRYAATFGTHCDCIGVYGKLEPALDNES